MRAIRSTLGIHIVRGRMWILFCLWGFSFLGLASASPTFTRDILPLLQEHCQTCHRPGQAAPMSLLTYEEVRPWAKAIRKAVVSRTMPPFHAAGPKGRFEDDLRLTAEAVSVFTAWIDRGIPRGNPADAPEPLQFSDESWHRPNPDLVVEFEPVRVEGKGTDQFVILESDYAFPQPTWVQAVEFLPSNRPRIHHAGVFTIDVDKPKAEPLVNFPEEAALRLLDQGTHLYTWLPGYGAFVYPEEQGVLIEAGSRLALQFHVGPDGESFTEQSKLGFWFLDGVLRYSTQNFVVLAKEIEIPPGDANYEFRSTQTVRRDNTVQSFLVHMHLRGKSSEVWFTYPDGRREQAFALPQFNFDWQRQYVLAEPQSIPEGTEIEYVAVWDNSEANPLNPDPGATVRWGRNTTDEMFSTTIQCRRERQRPARVENGRIVNFLNDRVAQRNGVSGE